MQMGGKSAKMKYRQSFYKWDATEEDADYVIACDVSYRIQDSERGNAQYMFVGFNPAAVLMEVAIEIYPGDEPDWAFHAKKAGVTSKKYWNNWL
jgi:hypothetical protein